MPPGIRILGVDDAPFTGDHGRDVLVIGCLYRLGLGVEGILSTRIRKDGRNATDRLLALWEKSRFRSQVHVLMLDGIALGGFNVVDIRRLAGEMNVVVMTVMRRLPDLESMRAALDHVESDGRRWRLILKSGPFHQAGPIRFQIVNGSPEEGQEILRRSTVTGHVPEPLRLAHLIGAGVMLGESRGGA